VPADGAAHQGGSWQPNDLLVTWPGPQPAASIARKVSTSPKNSTGSGPHAGAFLFVPPMVVTVRGRSPDATSKQRAPASSHAVLKSVTTFPAISLCRFHEALELVVKRGTGDGFGEIPLRSQASPDFFGLPIRPRARKLEGTLK
jgi:hypothetical protein